MFTIGICDDLYDARLVLAGAVGRILEKRAVGYQIFEFSSGERLLHWMKSHKGELDLVFLDIEMDGLSGMETARQLRKGDEGLQIVFVTGYPDYVFDGYTVGALGYLIKPPKAGQLEEVLVRALGALHRESDKAFLCRNGEVFYRIPRKDILYFFSERRKVTCVTREREYTFYGKLDEVAEEMGDAFVRAHQRYLVCAQAVSRIEEGQVFLGETAIPISRSCQAAAMVALTKAVLV